MSSSEPETLTKLTSFGRLPQSSDFGSKYFTFVQYFESYKSDFSLKNHGADKEVEGMFDMGAETMDLPMEEKMKFEQGDGAKSYG